jgi:hypothetical protein
MMLKPVFMLIEMIGPQINSMKKKKKSLPAQIARQCFFAVIKNSSVSHRIYPSPEALSAATSDRAHENPLPRSFAYYVADGIDTHPVYQGWVGEKEEKSISHK